MGVKGTCRSANRGGWLFYALSAYSKGASFLPAFILSGRQFSAYRCKFSAKSGKVNNFLVRFGVSSEFSETKKGKSEIYFGFWGFRCGSLFGAVVVSTECRWCAHAPSLWVCSVPFVHAFCPFPALLYCFAFQICPISRFKGVFGGFWGADVCLYGLRSLR